MTCMGKVSAGKVLLPPGVHLPDGTEVELRVAEPDDFTDGLLAIAQKIEGLPADLARCHDHYLHGHPRK